MSVCAQEPLCTLKDFFVDGEQSKLFSELGLCSRTTDAQEFLDCSTEAAGTNKCGLCMVSAVSVDDISCLLACTDENEGQCGMCAYPAIEAVIGKCFPPDVIDALLPSINTGVTGQERGHFCDFSRGELATLQTDLVDCFSHSADVPSATCLAERGYDPLENCGSCLLVGDSVFTCDCSEAGECLSCYTDRALEIMGMCVPQREWSAQTTLSMCSMEDVLAVVPTENDFRTLVDCIQKSINTAACWPSSVPGACSGCLETVIDDVHATCTGSCVDEIAGAVMGRCMGVVAPPQPAVCSKDDFALFKQGEADQVVIACATSHPDNPDACIASSKISGLSTDCKTCLSVSHAWMSDPSCATPCSLAGGVVTCTAPEVPCVIDAVDTSACFDPNALLVPEVPVCNITELGSIQTSFSLVDVNACLTEPEAVDAFKCARSLIGESTECKECVAASMSIVADCAATCDPHPELTACQDCVAAAVTQAAGVCTSQAMPKYVSNLIAKANSATSLAVSSMMFVLASAVILL